MASAVYTDEKRKIDEISDLTAEGGPNQGYYETLKDEVKKISDAWERQYESGQLSQDEITHLNQEKHRVLNDIDKEEAARQGLGSTACD